MHLFLAKPRDYNHAFKTFVMIASLIAFVLTALPALAQNISERPESFADLADRLLPTVVNISSSQNFDQDNVMPEMPEFPEGSPFERFFEEFMDRRQRQLPSIPPASLGSGFVIDKVQGYIVTNNHVIRDAEEVRVTFYNDKSVKAEILATDDKTDIALLKIDPNEIDLSEITPARFGDSDKMRVGDWVIAIGNPFGLGGTVTAGIISARQRDINAGPYDDFLQTDASINRGNSGGPMFNTQGDVIGINTAIFSPTGGSVGIGFAIPSNMAKSVIDQLISYGRTRRGWLGVRIQIVTDEIAESLGLDRARGALVSSVTEGGPAANAELKAGDIVLSFNGEQISEMKELPRLVASAEIGKPAQITLWRDGEELSKTVELGELEKAEEEGLLEETPTGHATKGELELEQEGLQLSSITPELAERFQIAADLEGVLITNVKRGSEAASKGLEPGDVVVEVNQKPVKTPQELATILDDVRDAGRRSALFLVNRSGDVRFVALRLK